MGKAEISAPLLASTDAEFQAWCASWFGALEAAGAVRTSDTGQFDGTQTVPTVTSSNGANPVWGAYVVYRFTDALQATHPLVYKIQVGLVYNSGTGEHCPAIELTVGKGSDGAGNVVDALFSRAFGSWWRSSTSSVQTATAVRTLASVTPSTVAFLPSTNHAPSSVAYAHRFAFCIERARDSQGTAIGDGLVVMSDWNYSSTSNLSAGITGTGTVPALPQVAAINYASGAANVGCVPAQAPYMVQGVVLSEGSSLAAGSIGPVMPWVLVAPGLAPWMACCIASIPAGDNPGGIFQTVLYNRERTMRSVPLNHSTAGFGLAVAGGEGSGNAWSRAFVPAISWED